MSLQPPKKSDLNKHWMRDRQGPPKRIQPEYHLIVSEGKKTEPEYFCAVCDEINKQYRGKIHLDVFGRGRNTTVLFNEAKKIASRSSIVYKHIWIVYDTDDFSPEDIDNVVMLCCDNSTEETEYHAIWSNQCIELWFLLHFDYMHSDIFRSEYYPKLSQHLSGIGAGKYTKNRKDIFYVLRPYVDTAIANAKLLDKNNKNKPPSKAAPGTKVFELIERPRPYFSEN